MRFTKEDFDDCGPGLYPEGADPEIIAAFANEKLDQWLEDAQTVYVEKYPGDETVYTISRHLDEMNHTAKLVCIEDLSSA